MDHTTENNTQHYIAAAADALAATGAHVPGNLSTDQFLLVLSDLATIAGLVGELATRTRQLAAWATVAAHLNQAEQHATDLRRCLNHACARFAFNTHPPTADYLHPLTTKDRKWQA